MNIIYYNGVDRQGDGLRAFQRALPQATVRQWEAGDNAPADYALVWKPPQEMLVGRTDLKAIFNLGAGVDALLPMMATIPKNIPIVRLEDAGMGEQMADYVSVAALRYFRRLDEYALLARQARWEPRIGHNKVDFPIAVLGLGVLGRVIAERLVMLGFPVLGWSRTPKEVSQVSCYHGVSGLQQCLRKAKIVVSILPLTTETQGILNRESMQFLPKGAYIINVGRGAHIVEQDLLTMIRSGHLAGATLDVVQTEPLGQQHPFWKEPTITITPHISALTLWDQSELQVAHKINLFERGLPVSGVLDRERGY